MKIERYCICCEKKLGHAGGSGEDNLSNPPNDATYWQTSGNYGSTVFDSPNETLEMYVCDECLRKKAKYVYKFQISNTRKIVNVRTFNPNKE